MIGESVNVFRYNKVHSWILGAQTWYLQYLHIVPKNILSHLVGTDVNNLDVRVFACCENSTDLGIFSLQKLLHWHSLQLVNREWIAVYFDSFSLLNCAPSLFKLLHHLPPNEHLLSILFFNTFLGLSLEDVESERLLNFSCFRNQKSQVGIGNFCFVHSPAFLDGCRC